MRVYLFRRFITILCGIVFAFLLFGCGTYEYVTVQSSYLSASAKILPDPTAILPTRAQDEADKRRLALPPELRARLQALVAQTWSERPDPRYLGDAASEFHEFNRKLDLLPWLITREVLLWATKETPEERAAHLHVRQLQPLPALKVEVPPVVEEPITLAHPAVQAGGGFVSGLVIGPVPLGPTSVDVAIQLKLLPNGTYWARVGRACGEVVVGTAQVILGCAGMSAGVGISGTGAGAPAGVLLFAESMAIAGNGILTAGHGVVSGVRALREGPPLDEPPGPSEVKLLARKGSPKPAQQPQPAAAPAPQTPPKAAGTPTAAPKPGPAHPPATTTPQAKPASAGQTPSGVAKPRGGENPAAARGRQVHEEFKQKAKDKGWKTAYGDLRDPKTNREVRPDALTKNGNPIELKPNTPSGRAAGKRQMKKYEAATERKGRVIYYDP